MDPRRHKFSTKKIGNREIRRRAQEAIEQGTKSFLICLAVLAQKGGEVIVTQGTLDQMMSKLDKLDFDVKPHKDIPGEFVVRVIDNTPSVTIEKVTDDAA